MSNTTMKRVLTLGAAALMMCGIQKAAAQESENKTMLWQGAWRGGLSRNIRILVG